MDAERRRTVATGSIDVASTVRPLGFYPNDPTHDWAGRTFTKAVRTPEGPGTVRLDWSRPGSVEATAWGDGAGWLLDRASAWLGLHDDLTGFDPSLHPKVERWWRERGTFRLGAGGVIWQELALVLLGQRVSTKEAVQSWARLCRDAGEPAPGPAGLLMPPSPDYVASLTYADLHVLNVERRRADTIIQAAKRAGRLEEAASMPAPDALARLTALPGIGAWSATSTVMVSHGDPDTVVLRDWGIPTMVNYAFTGDPTRLPPDEGGDDVMLAHLEPWAGHRHRVVRLLFAVGIEVPRRAPKMRQSDIRRY